MLDLNTLQDIPNYIEQNISNKTFVNYLNNDVWESVSSKEFVHYIYKLSHAFTRAGVTKGTHVAIVSNSSPFWLMVDYALQDIGAISVPMFANISSKNFIYQLEDAEIEFIYIASQECYDKTKEHLSSMKLVITHNVKTHNTQSIDFDTFIDVEAKRSTNKIDKNDCATIVYTSGSTGMPKGVELSHHNVITQLKDTSTQFPLTARDKTLSFLPLAHIFERMVMSYYLVSGISIYFADDVKNVAPLMKDVKPSLMTVVPRVLEKIYVKMHDKILIAPFVKKMIGTLALKEADNKEIYSSTLFGSLYEKLVYSKLLEAFGGNMKYVICGGAPLSEQTEKFFTNIGLQIYQGYGLTETAPVICANSPLNKKAFTCGKAYKNSDVKISSDGELLTRGASIMMAYHKQEGKTKEAIDENGWFHTGDLASIDAEGYISIKGRKKELFKTSNGKYIAAVHIEQELTQNRWCEFAVVVADNRPFVVALLFLDLLMIEEYAKKKHLHYTSVDELYDLKAIQILIQKLVEKVNKNLNHEEKVRNFFIVKEEASIESHILTPSMKVSRSGAYKKYEDTINSLYGELS
ncbi:AMP-binding protein [Sulfurimonas sp. SAG-AH-194-C21]|nr:AMP-binding protein [Sulfurimonas sp. SAG-AH-194-C21]MDF1882668.1 AMP-binding protein [Sulfurimonas sp. SAG-AH-194-C21]